MSVHLIEQHTRFESHRGVCGKNLGILAPERIGLTLLHVQGPLANLSAHLSNPFANNITKNIGTCAIPSSVDVQGLTIPLTCLWPGHH
jgi:hypothetical protein